jgi:hypothetical protein
MQLFWSECEKTGQIEEYFVTLKRFYRAFLCGGPNPLWFLLVLSKKQFSVIFFYD